jgi:uncharacterized protein (TIGR03067 family)
MVAKLSCCLATLLILGGGGGTEQKKELAKFAGTWTVTELIFNGKDHSNLKFNFVFKGDEAVIEGNDNIKLEYARLKILLDPTTKPKILDIKVLGGIQKDATLEGIYEFKGDELRICLKVFGNDRPSEFASPDGESIALLVLKRSK